MIELLQSHAGLALALAGVVGLLVGSFLNVVILRVPVMMQREWEAQCAELAGDGQAPPEAPRYNLLTPPSTCPACGSRIRPWHNVPVLSWLWLRGRCADCGSGIGVRYPVVEAFTGVLSVIVIWRFGVTVEGLAALGFTWALIAASVIDLDHTLLPDSITLPLLWAGLVLAAAGAGFTDPVSAILGGTFGYLALWSVYHAFRLLTGKEGMGHGDFKLLAALGAWLGWQLLPQVILLSALVGAAVGIALIVAGGRSRDSAIPFGPYLAAAGWIALLWGEAINRAYLGTVGL